LSAQYLETSGSGGFLMEIEYFSIFWQFSVESADAKRIFRIVLTNVGAVCSVGGCNLKSGCNLLFSWVLGYEPEVGSSAWKSGPVRFFIYIWQDWD
jgi:hypothetical protein